METEQKAGRPHPAHIPVMLDETLEHLKPRPGGVYVDGTIGLGGHAKGMLDRIAPDGRLIGLDRDEEILQAAGENLKDYGERCVLVHEDFRFIDRVLKKLNVTGVDGILLDLGISSLQVDNPSRGFTFREEGPLDMRMNRKGQITAFDLVNSLSEVELDRIIKEYGEERWHGRIARRIVQERNHKPIETTTELRDVIFKAIPKKHSRQRIHPATRTFQAIRIAVNTELEAVELALEKSVELLNKGGRIAVISFHSLEDRIVKHKFKFFAKSGMLKLIFKKPLRPAETEVHSNPRARSARLRVAERI